MTKLGWALVAGGFLLQLLIPLNVVELGGRAFLGIPGPLFGILSASVAMVVGVFFVYRFWYKNRAIKVDRPGSSDRSG